MLPNLQISKRLSAMWDYKTGFKNSSEEDFSQKVIEIATASLDSKIDHAINQVTQGTLEPTSLQFNLVVFDLPDWIGIGRIDKQVQKQIDNATKSPIERAKAAGVTVKIIPESDSYNNGDEFPARLHVDILPS